MRHLKELRCDPIVAVMNVEELALCIQDGLGETCATARPLEFARQIVHADDSTEARLLALHDRHGVDTMLREKLVVVLGQQLGLQVIDSPGFNQRARLSWPNGRSTDEERSAFFDEYVLGIERAGMKKPHNISQIRLPWHSRKTP